MGVFKIISIYFLCRIVSISTTDYCAIEKELCGASFHVACLKEHRNKVSNCNGAGIFVTMSIQFKRLILDEHNRYRHLAANGNLMGFPSASRMKVMHWSDELASLATQHAKLCTFEEDSCRATKMWKSAGQNIALFTHPYPFADISVIIRENIRKWWEQRSLVPATKVVSTVEKYSGTNATNDFFTMIRDGNAEIGCALINFRKGRSMSSTDETELNELQDPFRYLFICNYAEDSLLDKEIYDIGLSCSRCESYGNEYRCDETLKGMCEHKDYGEDKLEKSDANCFGNQYLTGLLLVIVFV